jgi:hypothetical protein
MLLFIRDMGIIFVFFEEMLLFIRDMGIIRNIIQTSRFICRIVKV